MAVLVSQPTAAVQSPKPLRQAIWRQAPVTHTATALAMALSQLVPHAPQFEALLDVSTQDAPQSVKPVGQRHTPAAQSCPSAQRVSQPPQWVASVAVLRHPRPAQNVCPAKGHAQLPPAQT